MPEPLEQPLDFDLSPALASISQLDDALQQAVANFSSALTSAITDAFTAAVDLPVTADTSAAEADVAALTEPQTIPVDADVSGVEESIAAATAVEATVPVEGDASDLADAIGDAIPTEATIPVDADTSAAQASIDAVAAVVPVDIPVTADTSAADDAIERVGETASVDVPVTADTSAADADIDSLGSGASITVAIDADTSAATADIDSLSVTITVTVDADTSAAQSSVDDLAATPVEIPVEADTTAAQESIDDLAGAASGASGEVAGLDSGVDALSATSGLAKGELGDLGGFISNIGGKSAGAVAGLAVLGGFIGQTSRLAADAQAQNERFADTFGVLADQVERINVGGLAIDLADLAEQSGTTGADIDATASRIGQLGETSGAADRQIVGTTQKLLALGATFAVNNPRLGDASDVTDKLTGALARGGRALTPFGIALSAAQIAEEALKETGKASADQLTIFDKITAGATLTVRSFGGSLGDDFAAGSQNAQVQLRSLQVQLEETLVALGGPLLDPLVGSLTEMLPVAQSAGQVLGELARIALSVAESIGPLLLPVEGILRLTADGAAVLADTLDDLGPVAVGLGAGLIGLTVAGDALEATLTNIALTGAVALGPIGWVGAAIGAMAALGLATSGVGDSQRNAADDTAALAGAFGDATEAGGKYDTVLGQLDSSVQKYLKGQLAAGAAGKTGADAANTLGVSLDEMGAALTGSEADFEAFTLDVGTLDHASRTGGAALDILTDALFRGRDALQLNASKRLTAAVQSGAITQADLDAAEAQHKLNIFTQDGTEITADYVAIATELAPKIDAAALAQQRHSDAQFSATDGARQLQQAVADGTVTLADAADVATNYGLSVDRATVEIEAAIDAQDRSAASTAQTTRAYGALVNQIAAGNVSEAEGRLRLEAMGFTADGAASAFSSLDSTISSAVDGIVSNLPTAADAAQGWFDDIKAGFDETAAASGKSKTDIEADLAALAANSDPQKFFDNLVKQAFQIASFTTSIQTLINEGLGNVAGFLAQQPIEIGAPLAAAIASEPNKAKARAAFFDIYEQATGPDTQAFFNKRANALGLDQGAALGGGILANGALVGDAVEQVATQGAARFHMPLPEQITPQLGAAARALAADPQIGQAAGEIGIDAVRKFVGPLTFDQAVTLALNAAHDAMDKDSSLAVSSKAKSKQTGDAFKPDFVAGVTTALGSGQEALSAQTVIQSKAGILGISVGENFASGVQNGLTSPSSIAAVEAGAAVLAAHIPGPIRKLLGITSPSRVGIEIGQQFVTGIAIGLTDSVVVDAAGVSLAQSLSVSAGASFARVGVTAVSSLVAGFNDPATIAAAQRTLRDLVEQATSASQAQAGTVSGVDQIVSSILGSLPDASAQVSAFGSAWSGAVSAQRTAIDAYHQSFRTHKEDLAELNRLQGRQSIAAGVALVAQQALDRAIASKAPESVVNELRGAAEKAQATFQRLVDAVKSGRSQLESDESAIADATTGLSSANRALATASNPIGFIRNLRDQTAANRAFERNIAQLLRFGDTDLAELLAKAGPEAAGKLAAGLASNRSQARMAEAAVRNASRFTDAYTDFIDRKFAPKVNDSLTRANTSVLPPNVVITADTTPVSAALAGLTTTGTSVPLAVVPTVAPFIPPVFAPAPLVVEPVLKGALPPFAPIHLPVIPDVAGIPPADVQVIPIVQLPLPPFDPAGLRVIPTVDAIGDIPVQLAPTFTLPLPALPPIDVAVTPHVDALEPVPLDVVPRVALPLPALEPLTVRVTPTVDALDPVALVIRPEVALPLPAFDAVTVHVTPEVDALGAVPLTVEPVLALPLPALEPISVRVVPLLDALPQLGPLAVNANVPALQVVNVATAPQSSLPQTLELDLTINVPGGTTLTATAEIAVPRASPTTTKTRLAAAVNAKVLA